ncbi:M18 family aminopeptidase [Canibacter oris]|uniref:M18 family aminopeptidase n=2 Tax=Canibacter oris TaxID=1365628 RepID=A0A840DM66_9MICO|nr:M18 family aminopeptidase [Canibacter oris]MBB4071158.1 aspartyl aminopeptidase [Canibacter oris]
MTFEAEFPHRSTGDTTHAQQLSTALASQAAYVEAIAQYVTESPTSHHAVAAAARLLAEQGFQYHAETTAWPQLAAGATGYTVRDGAFIAWKVGGEHGAAAPQPGFAVRIFGAHTDSPGFMVKPVAAGGAHGWQQLNVEVYGGPLLNSWLDRDLAIAGKVQLRDGSSRLLCTAAVARIPQLAIHLESRDKTALELDRQQHTQPVLSLNGPAAEQLIAEAAGVSAQDICGWELQLADTQRPELIGAQQDLFASGRMDNLSSVFAGLAGLAAATVPAGQVAVLVANDHEEVGSLTYSGAMGTFLNDVLLRLNAGVGGSATDLLLTKAHGWMMSADAGHGVHPNYPEKHDPVVRPQLGSGPMRKVNANQHYATDAVGGYIWDSALRAAGVQGQVFVSKNTTPCGTTIGPISTAAVGIRTLDVGVPLLSMHSARELAHAADLHALGKLAAAFFTL